MKGIRTTIYTAACLVGLALILTASPAAADQVILDDLIVDGSLCVGFDCVNGESFGFDTIRLKENNLRIHFDDTSSSASFPTANWRIVINDSSNGGEKYFGIEDSDSGYQSFRIEQGAGANAIYVDSGGEVGFGTSTPVVDVHIKSGNTPTLRLEQDGSSGFAAQTWDVAGNEANFFIRDVTNGSTLPIRIRPSAPTSAIDIAGSTGDLGVGTGSPSEEIHVRRTDTDATRILLENTGAVQTGVSMINSVGEWRFNNTGSGTFVVNSVTGGGNEFTMQTNGDLEILGELTTGGTTCGGGGCDLVFSPEYELESIDDHAAEMWRSRHLPAVGPTVENQPFNLTQKTGAMLNELEKAHIYIEQLHKRVQALEKAAAEAAGQK